MIPKRPIGVRWGEGGSHRESSLVPIARLGVTYDSQPHGYALFFKIQNRIVWLLYRHVIGGCGFICMPLSEYIMLTLLYTRHVCTVDIFPRTVQYVLL
jgi:hypothetical protein